MSDEQDNQGLDRRTRGEMAHTCACFNLRRAARLVTQRFDQALAPTGLKATQLSVLLAVLNLDGGKITALAPVLGMERTSLTRNLVVLEQRGLVEYIPGRDKRERRVVITPAGRDKLGEALPLWRQAQGEVVEAMGGSAWSGLLAGLHEVADKLG